jgi:hypothetical protein
MDRPHLPSGPHQYVKAPQHNSSYINEPTNARRHHATAFRLVFKVVKAALGGSRKGFSFHEYIAYEGMRDYQSGLSAVQIQNVRPKTTKTCVKFALRYGMAHTTIRLEDGTTAVRLGRGSKDKVVVYFHGGGYMAPALHQHPMCACGFAETIPDNTSVYILQYCEFRILHHGYAALTWSNY